MGKHHQLKLFTLTAEMLITEIIACLLIASFVYNLNNLPNAPVTFILKRLLFFSFRSKLIEVWRRRAVFLLLEFFSAFLTSNDSAFRSEIVQFCS